MTSDAPKTNLPEVTFVPMGLVLGAGVGSWLGDMQTGIALGLVLGSTLTAIVEWKNKKRDLLWPIVGVVALVWIAGLQIFARW